jgi:phytoene synthase
VTTADTLDASYRFCGEIARREARNFYHAFRLLPPGPRRSMCALYAFMRRSDDLADGDEPAAEKAAALAAWRRELDDALEGRPTDWPGLPALADVVRRRSIPPGLLREVIDGVEMDVEPRRFADFDELAHYCYHVASTVGLCCIHIWGFDSDNGRAERLAGRCGLALQLTNILRDVREDAERGRVYLPEDDLRRFGVEPRDLVADRPSEPLRALLAEYARRAYAYYEDAEGLAPLVDPSGRPVLLTIVGIYRALLDEIVRRDYDVLGERASVPRWRKLAVALRSMPARYGGRRTPARPDLAP